MVYRLSQIKCQLPIYEHPSFMHSSLLEFNEVLHNHNLSNYAVFIAIHDAYKIKLYNSLNGTALL